MVLLKVVIICKCYELWAAVLQDVEVVLCAKEFFFYTFKLLNPLAPVLNASNGLQKTEI